MEPLEYCRLYLKHPEPGKRGYRAACVRALEQATFGIYSYETIDRNWGSQFERRPDAVLEILKAAHTINAIAKEMDAIYPRLTELMKYVDEAAPYKKHK